MVKVSTVRMENKPFGVIYKMLGISEGLNDGAFDSELFVSADPMKNHRLRLTLNILLNQITSSKGLPAGQVMDLNKKIFRVTPWDAGGWQAFRRAYREEAGIWSGKFWLIPPDSYAALDVGQGDFKRRPNVACEIEINLVGSGAVAHRTISVANLDAAMLGDDANSATFRSHERLYDSLDTSERTNYSYDENQQVTRHAHYMTIPHEVGHALGLPHIGVTHRDPQCMVAIAVAQNMATNRTLVKDQIPAMYVGGSNAPVCYGNGQSSDRSGNIMGAGTTFEKSNAQPWVDRIALHTRTDPKDWDVSLAPLNPGTFV